MTGSDDKTIIVWHARTGKRLQTLTGHKIWVCAVAIDSENHRIVTGSVDKTAIVWDARTGKHLQTLTGHKNWVCAVVIDSENHHILSGSVDKTAIVWDARTGKRLQTLTGHEGVVTAVAIDGENHRIVTADKTAIVWDARTGERLQTLTGHEGVVTAVAIDGEDVVSCASNTGSNRQSVQVWNFDHSAFLPSSPKGMMWSIIIAALGCADESIPDVAFVEIANQILRGGLRGLDAALDIFLSLA